MGYTHYLTIPKTKPVKGTAERNEKRYQLAIKDCQRIIRRFSKLNGGLSGFTAHTKVGKYGGIEVNGSRENGHETFILREHFRDNEDFSFCKTAQKPYDVVVVACLTVLQHRLKGAVKVASDGDTKEWEQGVAMAKRVTGLQLSNPIKEEIEEEIA